LTVELDQQSPVQRWIGFQNHQLVRLEQMEEEYNELEETLSDPHTAAVMDDIRYVMGFYRKHIERGTWPCSAASSRRG
jgi:hypothetical protein